MDLWQACKVFKEYINESAELHEKIAVPRWENLYNDLIRRATIPLGSKVLDLGTGTGPVALKLAADSRYHVVGVDIAERMLKIAEEKKNKLGIRNVDFRLMDMSSLDFPENAFDAIVSNFSVCCVFSYDKTLKEAHRTLKHGGKLTYNHDGPHDSDVYKIFSKVFEKYKTKTPSQRLADIREASALQESLWSKYREPFTALNLLRDLGFKNPEVAATYHKWAHSDSGAYVDYKVQDNHEEFGEMKEQKINEFKKECIDALRPFETSEGLVIDDEVLYFSAYK